MSASYTNSPPAPATAPCSLTRSAARCTSPTWPPPSWSWLRATDPASTTSLGRSGEPPRARRLIARRDGLDASRLASELTVRHVRLGSWATQRRLSTTLRGALESSARLRAAWCSGRSAVQGRQDLNLRRAGLESAALAGLSYAPSVAGAWHGGGPGRDRFSGATSASSRARTSARVRNGGRVWGRSIAARRAGESTRSPRRPSAWARSL